MSYYQEIIFFNFFCENYVTSIEVRGLRGPGKLTFSSEARSKKKIQSLGFYAERKEYTLTSLQVQG